MKFITAIFLLVLAACGPVYAHDDVTETNRVDITADSGSDNVSDRSAKLMLHPTVEYPYGLIGWKNEFKCANKYMATITAHGLTNVKEGGVRYAHDHFSIYTADGDCKMLGRIDIPWGHDHTQIQVENADLVMKGAGTRIIMRDGNGYCEQVIDPETRVVTCQSISSSQIIKANVTPSDRGYPAELNVGD
jgi:hypothetical protein